MLVIADLADKINEAIDAKDKDNAPIATTPVMKSYAEAVITTLKAGLVNHAIPGSVVGVTAPGAPLSNGAALAGLISALVPSVWSGVLQAAVPGATALSTEATASTGYLMSASLVNFAPGKITGTSTSTPVAPGPLVAGAGTGGMVSGLAGPAWAAAAMPPTGDPALSQKIYTAIANYIIANAEATYLTGSISGTCPPASAVLTLGVGVGGTLK